MRKAFILSLLLLVVGCASARIEVSADLYGDTPIYDREGEVDRLHRVAVQLSENRDDGVNAIVDLRSLVYELEKVYAEYNNLLDGEITCDPDTITNRLSLDPVCRQLDIPQRAKYIAELIRIKSDIEDTYNNADLALSAYLEMIIENAAILNANSFASGSLASSRERQKEINERLMTAFRLRAEFVRETILFQRALDELESINDRTNYMENLRFFVRPVIEQEAAEIRAEIAAPADDSELAGNEILSREQQQQFVRIESGLRVAAKIVESLGQYSSTPVSFRSSDDPREILVAALFEQADGLRVDISSQVDLRDLARNQTFYNSQIDRLQDPADPVWREIINPANEKKWIELFAKSTFYAEGNAEVVVVRDRPGHYRLQRGVNNPAALIKNQLEISRAIASATTEILGAVSGVGGALPAIGNDDNEPEGEDESAQQAAVNLAGREAMLEEEERLRGTARRSMEAEIASIVRDLEREAGADNSTINKPYYDRVRTALGDYKSVLEFTGSVAATDEEDD